MNEIFNRAVLTSLVGIVYGLILFGWVVFGIELIKWIWRVKS